MISLRGRILRQWVIISTVWRLSTNTSHGLDLLSPYCPGRKVVILLWDCSPRREKSSTIRLILFSQLTWLCSLLPLPPIVPLSQLPGQSGGEAHLMRPCRPRSRDSSFHLYMLHCLVFFSNF